MQELDEGGQVGSRGAGHAWEGREADGGWLDGEGLLWVMCRGRLDAPAVSRSAPPRAVRRTLNDAFHEASR